MPEVERKKRNYCSTEVELGEPYSTRLQGLLRFSDFASAEQCLHDLDEVYKTYRSQSDRQGTAHVREVAILGKQRAASLARNPRIRREKRREKAEIALWFNVWLDVPDLFFDWLELRRQSDDFRSLFAPQNGTGVSD